MTKIYLQIYLRFVFQIIAPGKTLYLYNDIDSGRKLLYPYNHIDCSCGLLRLGRRLILRIPACLHAYANICTGTMSTCWQISCSLLHVQNFLFKLRRALNPTCIIQNVAWIILRKDVIIRVEDFPWRNRCHYKGSGFFLAQSMSL